MYIYIPLGESPPPPAPRAKNPTLQHGLVRSSTTITVASPKTCFQKGPVVENGTYEN